MPDKADHNYIKNVYQVAIDKFIGEMILIDGLYGTYAKISHTDRTTRPLQVHGMTSKPIRRVREIEIDEIVLDGIAEFPKNEEDGPATHETDIIDPESIGNDVSRFSDRWDAAQRKVNVNSPFMCTALDDYWLFVKKSDYTKICDIVESLPSSGLTAQRRIHILKILTNFFYKHNSTQKEQRIQEHATRQKYEYMFISIFLSMCKLNEYGKDGWELCGVTSDLFYFKRPL